MSSSPSLVWFRRDLRLLDHPALLAAAAEGGEVVPLFVLDPALWGPAGQVRRAHLVTSLRALAEATDGRLLVVRGAPAEVVPAVAREAGAQTVHVSADFGPYGSRRDGAVEQALAAQGGRLVRTGSPYAVSPGRIHTSDGSRYRVFTPYYRAWLAHGWRAPAGDPGRVRWAAAGPGDPLPAAAPPPGVTLPAAGERAALARWRDYLAGGGPDRYQDARDRVDLDATTRMSVHLRWGEVHPRTLLADLGASPGHEALRRQLAWREFYADVLDRSPTSARTALDPRHSAMHWDEGPAADGRFAAWCAGRTGYPFVDAGMRQLLADGWLPNRLRMVVASFLVKDLHLPWQRGARWFMERLADGDLASNAHGWQWTAGSGTDAAPYVRVMNPVSQGLRHDPDGDYVRRWVPELAGLAGATAHEPWLADPGPRGYPPRIVDHAAARAEALARHAAVRADRSVQATRPT